MIWRQLLQWVADRFPAKDIGWKEIDETFYRHVLFDCRWFRVYLHRLTCLQIPPDCHDHPWHFVTLILAGGYWEDSREGKKVWRRPGRVMYRPAHFSHRVWTKGECWSVIVTSHRFRKWGHLKCDPAV